MRPEDAFAREVEAFLPPVFKDLALGFHLLVPVDPAVLGLGVPGAQRTVFRLPVSHKSVDMDGVAVP